MNIVPVLCIWDIYVIVSVEMGVQGAAIDREDGSTEGRVGPGRGRDGTITR